LPTSFIKTCVLWDRKNCYELNNTGKSAENLTVPYSILVGTILQLWNFVEMKLDCD